MNGPYKLIDVHQHIGPSSITGNNNSEESLIAGLEKYGVDCACVLPHGNQGIEAKEVHDRIYRLSQLYPGRIYGIASLSPRLPEDIYKEEMRRCVQDLHFVALKLDPNITAVPIDSAWGRLVCKTALELDVPMMIHSQTGFANPVQAMYLAKEFPDLKIVLAHSGLVAGADEAIAAAYFFNNIYLDISWSTRSNMVSMKKKLGCEKLLFASDHIEEIPVELAKVQSLGLTEDELKQICFENAKRIFRLP